MLNALLTEFWRPLVGYAQRLLGDRAAAEDVVQRAFVRLWERDHSLPERDGLRPFFYRMVRNLASNEWRRSAIHARWLDEVATGLDDAPASARPDAMFEAAELEQQIQVAINGLPPRRREILVLSRYHHLSNAQIAEVLGISQQTVANQLVSALRTLRESLRNQLDGEVARPLRIVRGTFG